MRGSPVAERPERLSQAPSKRRDRVFDLGRDFPEVDALDDSVRLQLAQLLDQHLLAHPRHKPAQFPEAALTGAKVE